ncbi:glycosyltransferase [Candidatus Saccharibacteria bacterium]|nr:glycosyltransferase [Candidatus Saccharibacteria bacterium]
MDDNPLVSIIIPAYNVEAHLDECLQSVTRQSYRDIEIVLVDDGSTDNSGGICDEWAKKDKRIKVIHKKNEGLNYARRDGFNESTGDWICFIDSDDFVDINYVKILLGIAMDTGVDLVMCGLSWFYTNDDIKKDKSNDSGEVFVEKNHHGVIEKSISGWGKALMMVAHSKIINRKLFKNFDWEFSNYRINEDEFQSAQWYRAVKNGAAFTDQTLYFYRQGNKNSLRLTDYSNSFNGKKINKFDLISDMLTKRRAIFGEKYDDLLLHQMAVYFFGVFNDYITRGKLTNADIISIQEKILPLTDKVLATELDGSIKRAFTALRENGFVGYASLVINDLHSQMNKKDELIEFQAKRIAEVEGELSKTVKSRFRKMTKPLRGAKKLLGK